VQRAPLDIRIVGGGFAGVVTTLTLLDRVPEARVTIYEREDAAHTTLCGEGISDDTLRFFRAFDSTPYIAQSFEGASWFFPEEKEVRIHQRGHTMARESWIPAMAEACVKRGATYRTGVKVSAERVEEMAREADLVVGADGPGSVTRKVVGGRHATMLGIQYRVAVDGATRAPERLEFYTDKTYSPEYSWIFPRGAIQNVGLLAAGDGRDWERLDAFRAAKGVTGKVVKREAYPIGFFGDTVQRGNIVLVGDAAGLTNPITKGGMAAVVHAADVLSRCVAEARLDEYGPRLAAHPLMEPSFAPALAALRRWTNADYARLTRFAPDVVHVRPGASTERRYAGAMLLALATNADKIRDIRTVARAMGVSRRYSW
jgi:flavin-dependent dehydrogenase